MKGSGVWARLREIATAGKPAEALRQLQQLPFPSVSDKPLHAIGMYYFKLYDGGVERVMAHLADVFVQMGYRVVVFTDEPANGCDYALPGQARRVVLARADTPAERIEAWRAALADAPVDLIISHAWISEWLMWDAAAIKALGVTYLQHTHGAFTSLLEEPGYELQRRFFSLPETYRLFDGVVSLSRVDQRFWANYVPRSAFAVNPPTFRAAEIKPAALEGQRVLWLARLADQKQPLEAVEIFSLVHQAVPEARFDMVGGEAPGARYRERVEERVAALGLQDVVTLHGFQEDVRPFYHRASAFLSTSCYEGAPVALMESKACGLPCVAYALPYLEIMRPPQGLVEVAQGDRQQAAEALIRLLREPAYRQRMGAEARAQALDIDAVDLKDQWRRILAGEERFEAPDDDQALMLSTLLRETEAALAAGQRRREEEREAFQQELADRMRDVEEMPRLLHKVWTVSRFLRRYGVAKGLRALRESHAAGKRK